MKEHSSRGPVSSMPGSFSRVDPEDMCDEHESVPAAKRVQTETDSMGCEYVYMCQACIDAFSLIPKTMSGECDWCKHTANDLRNHRDFEEGMAGRIYRVCGKCRDKEQASLAEELAEIQAREPIYDDYDYLDDSDDTPFFDEADLEDDAGKELTPVISPTAVILDYLNKNITTDTINHLAIGLVNPS